MSKREERLKAVAKKSRDIMQRMRRGYPQDILMSDIREMVDIATRDDTDCSVYEFEARTNESVKEWTYDGVPRFSLCAEGVEEALGIKWLSGRKMRVKVSHEEVKDWTPVEFSAGVAEVSVGVETHMFGGHTANTLYDMGFGGRTVWLSVSAYGVVCGEPDMSKIRALLRYGFRDLKSYTDLTTAERAILSPEDYECIRNWIWR